MTPQPGSRRRVSLVLAALASLASAPGCEDIADFIDEASATTEAEPSSASPTLPRLEPEEETALPERPADSIARSETGVITFRSILENREMTRAERIRAFENLDPAALQKRVAQPNVSGAPKTVSRTRRAPSEDRSTGGKSKPLRRDVPVVMYSTDWCGVCKRARKYFEEQQIPFTEYDVDRNLQARNEYLLLNPRRSVPTIKIGNEVIVGFSPAAVEAALSMGAQ